MATQLVRIKDKLLGVSLVAALLLTHSAFTSSAFARDPAAGAGAYEWSAELVSYDRESGTVTLKARMDARADRSVLRGLSDGDPITITWTGLTWGAGIASITAGESTGSADVLDMQAEYVGTELDDIYLVFRVPVPEGSAAKLQSLQPGAWITATTAHDAVGVAQAVSAIRPYKEVG